MMDGRVGAIRAALDAAGFEDVQIMSYAAKYASAFYGPFRDAIGTSGALIGDKRTYQMDPGNGAEALREVALDLERGRRHDHGQARPALSRHRPPREGRVRRADLRLPGVRRIRDDLAGAAANGWIDGDKAMLESLIAFKRAGADGILTYFAIQVAEHLARQ